MKNESLVNLSLSYQKIFIYLVTLTLYLKQIYQLLLQTISIEVFFLEKNMKVKYLGTLFAASVLSLGLLTSCATPEGGQTDTGGDAPADSTAPADPNAAPPADANQ